MSLLTGARSLLASGASLPGDVLEDSRKRIGVAAISIAAIWLVILAGSGVISAIRGNPAGWRRAGLATALLGVFALGYWAHLRAGAPYIAPGGTGPGVVDMLIASARRPLEARFLTPAGYSLQPYVFVLGIPPVAMLLQFPGLAIVLRHDAEVRLPVLAYAAFWTLFTVTIGATSSYWGQLYTPLAIMGTAALVAWLAPGCVPVTGQPGISSAAVAE